MRASKGAGNARESEIFLVFELVITAEDKGRKKDLPQVFSGGYGTCKVFELGNS